MIDPNHLDAFLEALPTPTFVVGDDLRVIAANADAREVVSGLRAGQPLVMVLRAPNVHDAVRAVSAGGDRLQVLWRDRVPVERVFDVTVAPIDVPGGNRLVALTLDDLTESHRVDRMRADFVANASHELRTPLASLLGFVETLQGPARNDPAARASFLAIMADQARRMARLIDDLLSLSRVEQKRHIKPCIPVDLSGVVRHVADTLAPVAAEQSAVLELHVADGIVVPGDRDELVRVAENLIENALKYGRPREGSKQPSGRVEILLEAQRTDAVLVVRDHGEGIASEHLPRLTERFYRIDTNESRAKGGTGLGLALVKHIVAHHRGRFEIESVVGEGSWFTVTIPLSGKAAVGP